MRAVITTQKELAERIASQPGTKDWAPISIFCQCFFNIRQALTIPPGAFYPRPKVYSATLVFEPAEKYAIKDWGHFRKIVKEAFKHRRKMLVNNLHESLAVSKDVIQTILKSVGLAANIRAEQVTIDDFIRLSEAIKVSELS